MQIALALSALSAIFGLSAVAQPVFDSFVPSNPKCKDGSSNAIEIKNNLKTDAFQQQYYLNSSIYVPAVKDLYLDYVQYEKPCGVTYCNEEYIGLGRRDLNQVMSPQGSDCILAHESITTFVCQGGQGKVQVKVNKKGKAIFTTDRPVAYFGSWTKNGCVTAAHDGKSSGEKDFLVVDCSGEFQTGCVDIPVIHR